MFEDVVSCTVRATVRTTVRTTVGQWSRPPSETLDVYVPAQDFSVGVCHVPRVVD